MTKDLQNIIQSVQEYLEDEMTMQNMDVVKTSNIEDGILIQDRQWNRFKITVTQINCPHCVADCLPGQDTCVEHSPRF